MDEILTAEAGQVQQRARVNDIRKMEHHDLVFIMVDTDFFKEVSVWTIETACPPDINATAASPLASAHTTNKIDG
jgi:hypothetical protein